MKGPTTRYRFGTFLFDPAQGLFEHGKMISLTPKAHDTLQVLLEHHGQVMLREDLLTLIWPDSFVEENNLSQNISQLRKVLAGSTDPNAVRIETISKRGYRLVAEVAAIPAGQDADPAPGPLIAATIAPSLASDSVPVTQYAQSGDVNIAYQVIGDGPIDLVFVMGWVSHLEYFWAEPTFARFLKRLSSFSRLILFDKRGTGLSDRVPINELPTLEQRMDDVRAVMSAVGSERAALCGVSEGGVMSALFAATYPERTTGLVMIGSYATRLRDASYPWGATPENHKQLLAEIQNEWGGPVGLAERAPSVAGDPRFRDWWSTYLRMGASPGAAVALTRMNAAIDVRPVLPSIRVPTLVLHRKGDRCLTVDGGRYVASLIPNARFVELPGDDHLPFVGNQDEMLDEVEAFLTGVQHDPEPERVLATVLFVRAAGGSLPELPERLYGQFRREIEWFRGHEIANCGATFDGPARAIKCALAILEIGERSGAPLMAGLHTGECQKLPDGRLNGMAVDIAEDLVQHAEPGEVLVSNTVRDLVAGSGIRFTEQGIRSLKNAPGAWPISRVERTMGAIR